MTGTIAKEKWRHVLRRKEKGTLIPDVSKEKRDSSIKARGCANERSKQEYLKKEETAHPLYN